MDTRLFLYGAAHCTLMVLGMIGAFTVLWVILSYLTGYTWVGMPPSGGCWP